MYAATKGKNEKITGLDGQMVVLESDFEEMMRKRDEEKRKLELKFKDVYQRIKDIKQYTADEGKKVNESLKAYQTKYDQQLKDLHAEMSKNFGDEKAYQDREYNRGFGRCKHLEDELARERSDRIQSLNDQLDPIHKGMDQEFSNLEGEKNARVQKEREILQNLAEDGRKIEESIATERDQRQQMQGELMEKLENELTRQKEKIERIKSDTLGEFDKDRGDITKEMNCRFDHQDRTVRNISHFISTFQATLKAVGGKAPGDDANN